MIEQIVNDLAEVDIWLDEYVSDDYKEQPLAQDWARISKVIEELGEAIAELILYTGQNPRKGRRAKPDAMLRELADVALTAILASLHFTKDADTVCALLAGKVEHITERMNADIRRRNILSAQH